MSNLLTLRSQARLKAQIPSADYSTANLTLQINNAYFELASILAAQNESYFYSDRVKLNLAQNSAYYDLPSDFMKLRQARVAYSTPSDPEDYKVASGYDITEVYDIQAEEEDVPTSNPIVDIVGTKLKLKPTPTTAVSNGLELYYIARPSALAATGDTPVIPTEWHPLLETYGAREMCAAFNKLEKYSVFRDEYLMGVERMKKELAERDINKPIRFRSAGEAGTGRSVTELF